MKHPQVAKVKTKTWFKNWRRKIPSFCGNILPQILPKYFGAFGRKKSSHININFTLLSTTDPQKIFFFSLWTSWLFDGSKLINFRTVFVFHIRPEFFFLDSFEMESCNFKLITLSKLITIPIPFKLNPDLNPQRAFPGVEAVRRGGFVSLSNRVRIYEYAFALWFKVY